ncbi:GAF domain-containing sensor histidine kinase [soil metagenome]
MIWTDHALDASPDEAARMAAVRRYQILDTPPDGAFDRITALAARIFKVPIAIVSVVDHDRIWFKSHHGLEVDQIDRAPGLCSSAILHDGPWIINDAPHDPRALSNPLVAGEFGLKFYAGVPLRTPDGYNLGTLCVIDFEPRALTPEETTNLEDLASVVVDELELRLASRQAVEQAREKGKLKDAMMGMLSHELRTPVTTIYGAAQLLSRTVSLGDEERARDLFPDMVSESERLVRLIENLLVLTRLEQGRRLDTDREPVLLQRVLAEVVSQDGKRWPEREISLALPSNLPPVWGDQLYVEQIVRNLLSNALKYSPGDTAVRISASEVDQGGAIEVAVHDNGIGLPADSLESAFELLFRTNEAQRYAPGAGIGLYVCRRLLDAMGGEIWLERGDPSGVVVKFRLSVVDE